MKGWNYRNGVPPKESKPLTHAEFAAVEDSEFEKACAVAGVEKTRRQASKFRRKRGAAWEAWRNQENG